MLHLLLAAPFLAGQLPPPPPTVKDVPRLVQTLEKGPAAARLDAVRKLADLGADAKAAVPALIKALSDPDETLRRRAGMALVAVGPKETALVDPLVVALRHDDEIVQAQIGNVLVGIGPIATTKLIAILKRDVDPAARRGAAIALEPFGIDAQPAIKPLVAALQDPNGKVCLAAAKALIKIEPNEKASYPVLAEGMLQANARGRLQILSALTESGQQKLAAPIFRKMLVSTDVGLRHDAILGLRKLGADAVPVLLEGMQAESIEIRRDAATGLFDLVQAAKRERSRIADDKDSAPAESRLRGVIEAFKKAEPALTKALGDSDLELRLTVAKTLYQATGNLDRSLPALQAALEDMDPKVRKLAVTALRGVPDKSEKLQKLLLAAVKDKATDVRLEALTALWLNYGDTDTAQNALVEALKDPAIRQNAYAMIHRLVGQGNDLSQVLLPLVKHADPAIRARGVALLKSAAKDDDMVRAAIIVALKDSSAAVRLQAVQALTQGELAEEVVPALVQVLEDMDREVRMATVTALRRATDQGALAAPALVRSLRDKDDFVRAAAADSLAFFKEDAGACVHGLVKAVRDEEDDYVKERMVRTLALFGTEAKEAVPVLLEIIRKDPSFNLAILALGRIGPNAKEAAPVLIEALKKDGGNKNLHEALAGIGADAAAPELIKLLTDPAATTRQGAAAVLGKIGAAANAGDALEARLKDDNASVRLAAALAHYQVTGQSKAALQVFGETVKKGERRLRLQALKNLKDLAADAAEATPLLVMCLSDPDPMIRTQAEDSLRAINPEALEKAKAAM